MSEELDAESKDLWERTRIIFLSTQRTALERSQAERYLAMIATVTLQNGSFVVYATNAYAAELLRKDYAARMRQCMSWAGASESVGLDFKFDPNIATAATSPAGGSANTQVDLARQTASATPAPAPMAHTPSMPFPESAARVTPHMAVPARTFPPALSEREREHTLNFVSTMPLNPHYTFDEFVRGPSNSFAYAAAMGIVAEPGIKDYNPLFIHGGSGLGKTHIMQAIGNAIRRKNPEMAVCYLTAETFLNEYINALSRHAMQAFRERYRRIDILLVDDIQFLSRRDNFQDEFFNTFNALHGDGKQIVLTSDMPPKDLPGIEQRLISRFEGGMVQEIEKPSYETRLAILRKKAENADFPICDSILQYIAMHIKSHVRAMEGALAKVRSYLADAEDPTAPLPDDRLARLLKDFIDQERDRKRTTVEEVQALVARHFSVTVGQILSSDRSQAFVTPRQVSMFIARRFTTKSLPEIAAKFAKKHATVIHAIRCVEKRIDTEIELRNKVVDILHELGYELSDAMD